MPIVDVEIVTDTGPTAGLAERLAGPIGVALGAAPGRTWLRLRTLERTRYAESGGPLPSDLSPVFVTVAARRHPDPPDFEATALAVCDAVSAATGIPSENVHVLFDQDARGRVAFGGRLVD